VADPSPPRMAEWPLAGDAPRTRETPPVTPMRAAPQAQESRADAEVVGRPRAHGVRVAGDRASEASPAIDAAARTNAAPPPAIAPATKARRSEPAVAPSTARGSNEESEARLDPRAPQTSGLTDIVRRLTEDRLTALERSGNRDVVRAQPAADPRDHTAPPVPPPAAREPSAVRPAVRVVSDTPDGDTQLPAVRITIGRIEVRAVMPQPPAPLSKPVSPSTPGATSLDEYLKQRSGAAR
jgi:hypothetical protein